MDRIIEFPKSKNHDERIDVKNPFISRKLFNIADWTPARSIPFDTAIVDTWPFFAA